MDRADRRQRPPLHPVGHELREPAGRRGARRRPVADPAARLRERRGALYRVPGGELRRRAVPQSRVSRRAAAHRLRVDGDAQHGLRLPHRRRPAGDAEGAGNSQRLRCVKVCDRAADGSVAGRHAHSRFGRLPQGFRQGRLRAAAHPGLWRLRLCLSARLLGEPPVAAGPRLRLRHRAYPRRRRSRLSLVSRRQAGEAHQHLQRFRRRHALPDRPGLRRTAAASPRQAAPPAAS